MLDVLTAVGSAECWHKKSTFKSHLMEVYKILKLWGADDSTCRCALFHRWGSALRLATNRASCCCCCCWHVESVSMQTGSGVQSVLCRRSSTLLLTVRAACMHASPPLLRCVQCLQQLICEPGHLQAQRGAQQGCRHHRQRGRRAHTPVLRGESLHQSPARTHSSSTSSSSSLQHGPLGAAPVLPQSPSYACSASCCTHPADLRPTPDSTPSLCPCPARCSLPASTPHARAQVPRQRLIQVDLLDKQPLGTNDLQVPPGGMKVPHIRCAWRLAVQTCLTAALAATADDACHIPLA